MIGTWQQELVTIMSVGVEKRQKIGKKNNYAEITKCVCHCVCVSVCLSVASH